MGKGRAFVRESEKISICPQTLNVEKRKSTESVLSQSVFRSSETLIRKLRIFALIKGIKVHCLAGILNRAVIKTYMIMNVLKV